MGMTCQEAEEVLAIACEACMADLEDIDWVIECYGGNVVNAAEDVLRCGWDAVYSDLCHQQGEGA